MAGEQGSSVNVAALTRLWASVKFPLGNRR